MKKILRFTLIVVAILTAVVLVRFAMLGHGSKAGKAPGLVSGSLSPCPDKPNCVCSEFGEDPAHYIAPLDYAGVSAQNAMGELLQIIEELGGDVVVSNEKYIAATFSSFLFGFVDDVEFRLEALKERIQIRSASRVGHSDLGVNQERAEKITQLFDQSGSEQRSQ